jgi:hypothetical protein
MLRPLAPFFAAAALVCCEKPRTDHDYEPKAKSVADMVIDSSSRLTVHGRRFSSPLSEMGPYFGKIREPKNFIRIFAQHGATSAPLMKVLASLQRADLCKILLIPPDYVGDDKALRLDDGRVVAAL